MLPGDLMKVETYWPTIRRIAGETAFRLNGYFGYDIVSKDDLAGDIVATLLRKGIDLGEMEKPNGYIATMARFLGMQSIDDTLRPTRDEEGGRVGTVDPVDFQDETLRQFQSRWAEPEGSFLFEEKVSECEAVIAGILQKVPEGARRNAVESFYLRGKTLGGGADRKARTLGQRTILPEEVASLQVWRAWLYPELRNRTPETEATPLLAVLLS